MDSKQTKQEHLKALVKQKDDLEKSILDITEYLEQMPGNPGVKEKLVDEEGFPRSDIDIFEVRKMRNRLACMQTDHVSLMKQIEAELFDLHSDYKKEESKVGGSAPVDHEMIDETKSVTSIQVQSSQKMTQQEVKIPFAWISDVIKGSPAERSGLQIGDAIYKFGPINHENHESLQAVVNTVKQNLNFAIPVKVLRKSLMGSTEDLEIQFVPQEWGGRGYLGCALKTSPI